MDYEGAVNEVLKRMRVATITAVTDNTYSTLMGTFVNQAKREVEDAWDWEALRGTTTINTVAATTTYALAGTNHRTRIAFIHNTTNKGRLLEVSKRDLERQKDFTDNQTRQPAWYRINIDTANDQLELEVYPIPDGVYDLDVHWIAPDDDLTADTDVIKVPYYPVVLGAYVLALAERGDESGTSERRAQAEYKSALSDAIALDNRMKTKGYETDWHV